MENVVLILENPNVAYLLLWAGLSLALLAVLTPGTGVLEIGALFCLFLAGYAVFNLEVNFWALGIILLGVVFFVLSLRYPEKWVFLALAIAALIVGSIFLFRQDSLWQPAVDPLLALIVSTVSGLFFWFVTKKVMDARSIRPAHDLTSLIGEVGETKTTVHEDGSVQIGAELWSARSDKVIPSGSQVRVVERDGFTLVVEPLDESEEET